MFQEPQLFADVPSQIHPRLAAAVADAYVAIDSALARILRRLHPRTIVSVLSEHGMAAEPVSTEIGPWHYVLRPARLKELLNLDPSMPAMPVARWIALRPPTPQATRVAENLRSVRIAGTDLPLFQIDEHRGEVIVKLALRRETLPVKDAAVKDDLDSLSVCFQDRTVPFTWLAERFGRRRSAMHAEEGVFILAGSAASGTPISRLRYDLGRYRKLPTLLPCGRNKRLPTRAGRPRPRCLWVDLTPVPPRPCHPPGCIHTASTSPESASTIPARTFPEPPK